MNQALIVIDAQQELIDGNEEEKSIYNKIELLDKINSITKKAILSNFIVIFMRDTDVAEGKGEGFEIHKDIKVSQNAYVFDKEATNSFYRTPLMAFLKEQDVKHLVVMGCKTEHCIDTAVRTATVNGFDVTLVGDGHSTTDSEFLTAPQIIAHHNEVLHGQYIVDNFSVVRNANEDLFDPTHDSYR